MAYNVVTAKVSTLGFCCPFAYFYAVRQIDTDKVARELGVTERTTRRWRAKYRNDKLPCYGSRNCFLTTRPLPEQCRGSRPVHVEGLDLALAGESS